MIAIIDFRADEEIIANLENRGFKVIKMRGFEALPKPCFAHPDMLMFIGGDTLFTHTDYYKIAKEELDLIAREKLTQKNSSKSSDEKSIIKNHFSQDKKINIQICIDFYKSELEKILQNHKSTQEEV